MILHPSLGIEARISEEHSRKKAPQKIRRFPILLTSQAFS